MARSHKTEYLVLLADDSEDDGLLLEMAFGQLDRLRLLPRMEDGEQTIDYLSGSGKYSDRRKYPFPDLLLLDLNMPRVDGFQVLEWLRAHHFPKLVVAVLSGSDRTEEIAQAMELGAHFFHTKELGQGNQLIALRALERHVIRNKNIAALKGFQQVENRPAA
jgi:CheY-like chemotaxis protein